MSSSNRRLLVSFPWHRTPLGPLTDWPPEMCSMIGTIMASDFPLCSVWGDDFTVICNDRFSALIGNAHPASFGTPLSDGFFGDGPSVRGALEQVRRTGEPLVLRDISRAPSPSDETGASRFDLSVSAISSLGGDITGLLLIAAMNPGGGFSLTGQGGAPDRAAVDARFTRTVAHDLNNLLTVILGSLDMLEENLVAETDLKLQTNALHAAEEAVTLTNRLLVAARQAGTAQQPPQN